MGCAVSPPPLRTVTALPYPSPAMCSCAAEVLPLPLLLPHMSDEERAEKENVKSESLTAAEEVVLAVVAGKDLTRTGEQATWSGVLR